MLIVGLGNPGEEYTGTRHNIGFETIEKFCKRNSFENWTAKKDLKAEIAVGEIAGTKVIVCKPQTYMNQSGEAVSAVQRFFRIYNSQTLVVYDELALELGQLRTRVSGSDAGHNGVKSLIQYIGEDFGRLRIGIGPLPQKMPAEKFVLAKFNEEELKVLGQLEPKISDVVNQFISSGELPHDTITA